MDIYVGILDVNKEFRLLSPHLSCVGILIFSHGPYRLPKVPVKTFLSSSMFMKPRYAFSKMLSPMASPY